VSVWQDQSVRWLPEKFINQTFFASILRLPLALTANPAALALQVIDQPPPAQWSEGGGSPTLDRVNRKREEPAASISDARGVGAVRTG
jgi:hypothetical protein